MSWVAVGTTVFSLAMKAEGASQSAEGARRNAERIAGEKRFESAQLRQQAGQALATSEIQAAEQRRMGRIVQSRTLAVAAAGGGGVSDPSIVNLLARVAGEGSYRSSVALYGGEEKARILRLQAAAADYEGEAGIEAGSYRASAYETQGAGSMLAGAGSLFDKFNTWKTTGSTQLDMGGGTLFDT